MLMNRRRAVAGVVLASGLLMGSVGWWTAVAQPVPADVKLTATTFTPLQKLIKPQPGESRWLEVPWLTDVHEARKKAAAEGKPLFIYSGGGATGIGPC
jgi:hypothetical protein